jgi:hypothetical protein
MNKWNMSLPWVKKSDYILRCIEEKFGPSNSGNAMWTLKFEVAHPETVINDDSKEMSVAGTPIQFWAVTNNVTGSKDTSPEEATAKARDRYKKLLTVFELPTDDINWDNPSGGFKGKLVYALVDDNESEQRGTPTKADLAKGIKQGPVLINPKNKKPLKSHYPKIVEIFGLAELPTSGGL